MNNSRRNFLRGLGACVALPAMQSMMARPLIGAVGGVGAAPIATTATGAPLRTAFLSFPNGAIPNSWWPDETGKNYAISETLKPLDSMRDSFQLLKGLDMEVAEGKQDGGGDHARGNGTFLTGVRLNKSATDIRAGVSIDQIIANGVSGQTRFPSLELASDPVRQASGCDSGYSCAYQYNISWKSESTPMATENNPRLVFERLFGAGNPGQRVKNLQQRREEQRSILDFVMEDTRSMTRRLQRSDKQKLDEYLSGVRELERRIQKAESFGDPKDPGIETPVGIPPSHTEYVNLMYDLMVLAFQTDSTRVCSLMLGHDGDNRSYDFIGISEGHHDLSHHQNKEDRVEKVKQIDLWYVQQFAKFLQKLENTKDVDGNSILHNSMVLFGSGNADGNRHTHSDLPIVLAGSGGGRLTPGRFVDHKSKPLSNLYVTLAQQMGVESLERFGDSTGAISDI
ncbi:DUF1552 domain-containing protein [Mariniblastus fucicola]|uniref:DUF1552 domain-containing protein n=1 Tax=Mariniblastus fucicola TaxID=980251 RepID=A0A5B9PJV0_9BACT|nr:DUF1552 domain-containing protein [Mariniblastus fucicola]QEG25002.1 hypothetical protein MFFC18_49250 [Mariniblastus fucicola]